MPSTATSAQSLATGGLAGAMARGREQLREWTRDGTLISGETFARARGVCASELAADEAAHGAFSLLVEDTPFYPAELLAFQQSDAAVLTRALGGMDAASKFVFVMRKHGALGGITARQALATGRLQRVLELADAWVRENGAATAAV